MKIKLSEIEPYAIEPVDNHTASSFLRHLTGHETFEFYGLTKPKSMFLYDLNYKYPRLTSAHGYLLSIDIDTFESICESNPSSTLSDVFNNYLVGEIHIDLGGNLSSPSIYSEKI
jgi:hypothetical protein